MIKSQSNVVYMKVIILYQEPCSDAPFTAYLLANKITDVLTIIKVNILSVR